MSITPPPNVSYGRVVWQALSDVTDGPDVGTRPDFIAPTGEVTFVASTVVERNATATPNPVSILRDPITGVLDSEGYLCTPGADGLPDYRGVDLIATDDPDLNPTDWVYNVSYKVKGKNGRQIALAPHQIYVPTDAVVDLTTVGPVDNATAIGIPQAEALAAQAAAAAADASVAASQALAAADAAEDAAAAAQSSVAGKQDKNALDADVAAKVTTPNSATQTALSAQIAAGITGKQDKSSLDADVATKAGTSGSATQVAVTALVAQLKVWARNLDQLIVGAVSRDSNGAATSAPVKWPDGSPGTYTATTLSTAFPGAVDAYTVTYGSPVTRTITQPAVTRDASGAVTNLPELTVA